MPRPRERDPGDKIKRRPGKRPKPFSRRRVTGKLREALARTSRRERDPNAAVEAEERAERYAGDAASIAVNAAGRGLDKARRVLREERAGHVPQARMWRTFRRSVQPRRAGLPPVTPHRPARAESGRSWGKRGRSGSGRSETSPRRRPARDQRRRSPPSRRRPSPPGRGGPPPKRRPPRSFTPGRNRRRRSSPVGPRQKKKKSRRVRRPQGTGCGGRR